MQDPRTSITCAWRHNVSAVRNAGIFRGTLLLVAAAVAPCAHGVASPHADKAHAEKHWTLKTEDTELEVGVRGDAPVLLSLRAPGSSWNWIQDANSESLPATIVRDGATLSVTWTYVGAKYFPNTLKEAAWRNVYDVQ